MSTPHPQLPTSGEVLGFVLGALRLRQPVSERVAERTLTRALSNEVGVKVETRREVVHAAVEALFPDDLLTAWGDIPASDRTSGSLLRRGFSDLVESWLAAWDHASGSLRSSGSPVPDRRFAILPWVRLIAVELGVRAAGYLLFRSVEAIEEADKHALTEGRAFDRLIARYRARAGGISRDELARGGGVAPSTVDEWLAGRVLPQADSILSLAAVLARHVPGLTDAEAVFNLRLAVGASEGVRWLWEMCPRHGQRDLGPERAASFVIEFLVVFDFALALMLNSPISPAQLQRREIYWAVAAAGSRSDPGRHILEFVLQRARDSFLQADVFGVLHGKWYDRVLMLYRQIPTVDSARRNLAAQMFPPEFLPFAVDMEAWGKVSPNPNGWLFPVVPGGREAEQDDDEGMMVLTTPSDPTARGAISKAALVAQHLTDDPDAALAADLALVQMEPNNEMYRFWLGCALARVGRPDDGIVECAIAVDLKPGWSLPAVEIAIILTNAGRSAQALEVMRQIEGKYEVDAHLANAYGFVLMTAELHREAIRWFRRALELNAEHARAMVDLAHCLLVVGERVEGRKWAKAARHHGEPWAWEAWKAGKYEGDTTNLRSRRGNVK